MNDQECIAAYQLLLEALTQNKLGWVAAQVEEQIRLGRTVEKEIETLREDRREFNMLFVDAFPGSFRKGPKAKFPVTIDYKPPERLRVLLDAIEQVVIHTADMENRVIDYFGGEQDNWSGLSFLSEDANGTSVTIDKHEIGSRLENARRLKTLLHDLREEVEK